MSDRNAADTVGASETTPPLKARSPRLARLLRRKRVVLPVLSVLLIGADAWLVVAIQGWQDQADTLRTKATDLGMSLATVEAKLEGVEAEIKLVEDQQTAAEDRIDTLAGEATAERARMDAFMDVSLAFVECSAGKLQIVRGLWEHGRGFVADLEGPTAATCEAAQASLDNLLAGD